MTFDEIIAALKSSGSMPNAALPAGVAHADALAPLVYGVAAKLGRGVHLLPADHVLLFFGLHSLAAARHPGLYAQVVALARLDMHALDQLFPDHATVSLARLLLTVWDGDVDALLGMIEHADMVPEAKWALYDVLARLTHDGRIARDRTQPFLERIERDTLIDEGDMTWFGWEVAVMRLGLTELEPNLRRVWSKAVYAQHLETDHDDVLEELRNHAADPADASEFDAHDIRAIDDPVEAVAWVERRRLMQAQWLAERAAEQDNGEDPDVAAAVRLADDERDWLAGFLVSRQVPDTAMSFEMLDGFFTALVIGPAPVPPSEYLREIWGTEDGSGPDWDSQEQAELFLALIAKHWNAIATRRSADAPHAPDIEPFGGFESDEAEPGEEWSDGFALGTELRREAWDPIFADRRADEIVWPIMAISSEGPEIAEERLTPEMRQTFLDRLPELLRMIAAYWRDPARGFPRREPLRSTKVGRNEACPCGSGKKFKRCCGGGAASSTLH